MITAAVLKYKRTKNNLSYLLYHNFNDIIISDFHLNIYPYYVYCHFFALIDPRGQKSVDWLLIGFAF